MKILHIITGLDVGGAEQALYNILAGGLTREFDCAVLTLRDEGHMAAAIRYLDVPVHTLGLDFGLPRLTALLCLRELVREFRPDVIQGWMSHGNLAASLATRMMATRPLLSWNVRQSLYDLGKEKWLTQQVIRANRVVSGAADRIIYNSYVARDHHQSFGFANARSSVIPNGFDLIKLKPDPKVALEVRRELRLPVAAPVIGHVARFHPMKDHTTFLRSAVQVARLLPDVRFLLAGRDVVPGNLSLAEIIPTDQKERFILTGERRDIPRLMQAMDVLCSSSSTEAFPNVLGEAMACAVPCVATDVGDSASIVGQTGLIVPPFDWKALAQAIIKMLELNSDERRALGWSARHRISTYYSLDAIVDSYVQLYTSLISREC